MIAKALREAADREAQRDTVPLEVDEAYRRGIEAPTTGESLSVAERLEAIAKTLTGASAKTPYGAAPAAIGGPAFGELWRAYPKLAAFLEGRPELTHLTRYFPETAKGQARAFAGNPQQLTNSNWPVPIPPRSVGMRSVEVRQPDYIISFGPTSSAETPAHEALHVAYGMKRGRGFTEGGPRGPAAKTIAKHFGRKHPRALEPWTWETYPGGPEHAALQGMAWNMMQRAPKPTP